MNRREKNKEVLAQTLNECRFISPTIQNGLKESVVYRGTSSIDGHPPVCTKTEEVLVDADTLKATIEEKNHDHIAVLNFASYHHPGGGVRSGANTQEEALCRMTSLLPCLESDWAVSNFYKRHDKSTPMYGNDFIYVNKVVIFGYQDIQTGDPIYLDESNRFSVDVITSAAPNLSKNPNTDSYDILKERADGFMSAAVNHGITTIVLGAWGCGVFKNKPETVFRAFHDLVASKYSQLFKRIVYAVPRDLDSRNYTAFAKGLNNVQS